MKHPAHLYRPLAYLLASVFCLLNSGLASAQGVRMPDLPAIAGAAVDPATDLLWLNDTSAGTAGSKKITLAELVNVSAFTNGNFLAANSVEIPQVNGLQPALDAKANAAVGLMEDFSDNIRWPNDAVITHNVTQPRIGPDKFWLSITGTTSPVPKIQNRAYGTSTAVTNQLWYLGSTVPTTSGKMSLGFQFELRPNPTTTTAYNNIMNISYSETVMQPVGGGIEPNGVVHINFDRNGVSSIGLYGVGGGGLTCLNGTYNGTVIPWNTATAYPALQQDRVYAILLKQDGDYLTITIPGVSNLIFYRAGLSSKVGASKTYFWFEDGRGDAYASYGHVVKMWGGPNSPLDSDPAWGGYLGGSIQNIMNSQYHIFPGTIITNPLNPKGVLNSSGGLRMQDGLPAVGFAFKGAASSETSGVANGGNVAIEGGYWSNLGSTSIGGSQMARASMMFPSGITATKSSAAGAETTLHGFSRFQTQANGDSQGLEIYGQLVGTQPKRIRMDYVTYGGTLFDSNLSGTPLDAISGPYMIRVRRFTITGAGSLTYATMQLPDGTWLPQQRLASNLTSEYAPINFKTTTTAAGGVTLDGALCPVDKVTWR